MEEEEEEEGQDVLIVEKKVILQGIALISDRGKKIEDIYRYVILGVLVIFFIVMFQRDLSAKKEEIGKFFVFPIRFFCSHLFLSDLVTSVKKKKEKFLLVYLMCYCYCSSLILINSCSFNHLFIVFTCAL